MDGFSATVGAAQLGGQLISSILYLKNLHKEFKNAAENHSEFSADLRQISQVARN
jgi:hypothetical protein